MRIYFKDEVRGIPTGYRRVEKVKVGRKWVYMSVEGQKVKISKVLWETLKDRAI